MISCPSCGTAYPPTVRLCPKDGTVLEGDRPTEDRFVGVVLDGKYRLDSYLSSGGMGSVFRATHVMLGKPVAVKLIKADLVTSADVVRRFQREARAATSLNHPNIVSVYDLGQTDDGTVYIAMELVEGRSLKEEIRQHGRLGAPRIVEILRQVAGALALAHRHHIIHRDLKPQNVMLARDADGREIAKLLDFGIAKTFDEVQTQLTAPGFALGTPQYMSPEQAMGADIDGRSDIYSLGVMLYEMLVGEVPFTDPSTPAVLVKHMTETPAPPSRRRPDIEIPPRLEAVALTCLEKDPAKRYQTADEVAAALDDGGGAAWPERAVAAGVGVVPVTPADPDETAATPAGARMIPPAPAPPATGGGEVDPLAPAAAGASGTRPTVPAGQPPPAGDFQPKAGSSFGALGLIAAIILCIGGLGAALWLLTGRGTGDEQQAMTTARPEPPATNPATALAGGDAGGMASARPDPPAGQTSPDAPPSTAGQGEGSPTASAPPQASPASAGAPATASRGVAAGSPPASTAGVPAAGDGRPAPRSNQTARSGSGRAAASPTEAPAAAQPPPGGLPAQTAPATVVPRLPAEPSVFVECRGAGEVCGAVRSAFDEALQRERLTIARSSERADIILLANVTTIDERREQQFGTVVAVRTYSIEMMGDVPRLDQVIPMPAPRTFSFDQRLGAERAGENARVVAIDAVGRVREFVRSRRQ